MGNKAYVSYNSNVIDFLGNGAPKNERSIYILISCDLEPVEDLQIHKKTSTVRKSFRVEDGVEKGGRSRRNRRPVYKPKSQEGVTDFQALLKIPAASNVVAESGGGVVKASKEEAGKVVGIPNDESDKVTDTSDANENNGNDESNLKANEKKETLKWLVTFLTLNSASSFLAITQEQTREVPYHDQILDGVSSRVERSGNGASKNERSIYILISCDLEPVEDLQIHEKMSTGRKSFRVEDGVEKGGRSRRNRRPVYKPKSQEGVTDFQALLKIPAASNVVAESGGGVVKASKEEAGKVVGIPNDESDKVTDTSDANENNGNVESKLKADNEKKETLKKPEEMACDIRDPQFSVFIPRDFSGADEGGPIMVRFSTEFPQELNGVVTMYQFQFTVGRINELFYSAQKLSCGSFLESVVGYLSCTLIYVCKKTRMEKAFERIGRFLYEENEKVYHPLGLHVVHPMCRGLRTLVIRSIANYPLYYSYGKEDEK